ncbi:MAG: hypothetical protein Q8N99_06140 [Nanoarchaeota archaeon]|nr:hypothetical protein [Nanoarchaeota archaeon]
MKTLIAYYSRTGTTKKIARELAEYLSADEEGIIDLTDRDGAIGYIKSRKDALLGKTTNIKTPVNDPREYDLVLLGTPVWAGRMAPAMRTYMKFHKDRFGNVACFCTMKGASSRIVLKQIEKGIGKKPLALMSLQTKEAKENLHEKKIKDFIKQIKKIKKVIFK